MIKGKAPSALTPDSLRKIIRDEVKHLATKDEFARLATKEELTLLATKEELTRLATKKDIEKLATRDDIEGLAISTANQFEKLDTEMKQGFEKVKIQINQQANKAFEDRTEVSTNSRKISRIEKRVKPLEALSV